MIQIYKETGLFTFMGFVMIFIFGYCFVKSNRIYNNALQVYGEEIKKLQKTLNEAATRAKDFFMNRN